MKTLQNVKFLPWIGNQYANGRLGVKTLILGESHYQWNCDRDINTWREITQTLIQEQLDGAYTKAFWTKIAISFLGHKPNLREKNDFWHSVAFYNYVQESAGDGPRIAPNGTSWKSSEKAFFDVLTHLRPNFILALGDRLSGNLPSETRSEGVSVEGAPRTNTWQYRLTDSSQPIFLYSILHPSRGFNGRTWKPFIEKAMNAAEQGAAANP